MYDIRYHAMCAHHSFPFTTTDQTLMATILDATVVKVSAHKCSHRGGFDCLVDRCPFPQTALLEMVETLNKGTQARQMPKPAPAKSTSLTQMYNWHHKRREGCNNYKQDTCTFPNCKQAHVCHSCKQEHPASQCSFGGTVTTTSQ